VGIHHAALLLEVKPEKVEREHTPNASLQQKLLLCHQNKKEVP
jgi:hypothetical protein